MNIPLCHLLSMPIFSLTLKIDVSKMEHAFFIGYQEGEKVFYV